MVTSLTPDDLGGRGVRGARHARRRGESVRASGRAGLLRGKVHAGRDDRVHRPAGGESRLDCSTQDDRGPLPERGGEAHPRGQAGQLREARSQGAFRPVVAGPLADPAQTVQRRHGPRIDGITFRIPEAVADHRPEAFVGRHHGRRRTRSDPVVPLECRPVRTLVDKALVDDEAAIVTDAFTADRVDVQGKAAAVRAAGGIRTRWLGLELPLECHITDVCRRKLTHCVTSRGTEFMTQRVAHRSRSRIASNSAAPFGDRRYSTATGRSRWTFRSAIPTSSSSFSVFARELWHMPVATRSSLKRFGPESKLWRTVSLSSEPTTSKAIIAPHPGPSQGLSSSATTSHPCTIQEASGV